MSDTSKLVEKENTMRALQGKAPLYDLDHMVSYFQSYVGRYELSESVIPKTFIRHMLYGIGRSMSREYEGEDGFLKFEESLKEIIDADLERRKIHDDLLRGFKNV